MPFKIDKNYYLILKLNPSAMANEIRMAYYKLARETHPDKNPGSDGNAFKLVSEAYEVLSDEIKRAEYDDFLVESQNPSTQTFANSKQSSPKKAGDFFEEARNNFTKTKDYFAQQKKTRQSKEEQEANQRMRWLHLSKEKQTELWGIHQKFSQDVNHFQQNKYSIETIKNLLYVFCDISLSHLDEACRSNPDVVDVSFHHSFAGLRYASKNAITQLLDRKDSEMYKQLTYTQDSPWIASEFLHYYPYDVDTSLFIKLMLISPALIKPLQRDKILAFLRDPQCRQHKDKLHIQSLYKANKYGHGERAHGAVSHDLDILFEIYQHYNRNVLRQFDSFDDYSQNRSELIQIVKRLFAKYPNHIDLIDIISIDRVVDQESLCFSYDAAQETLTCTGKLVNESGENECTFSSTKKVMAQNTSWYNQTFVSELATSLQPKIFCKMLASIPDENRAHYLFSPDEFDSAYYAYTDRLNRAHYCWGEKENQTKKVEKTKEHLDALAGLIYPVKPISEADLIQIKQQICTSLQNYTAWWKLSIFGHHHEARARHVINTINKANSLAQIGLIIDNQLALLENKVDDTLFKSQNSQFTIKKIVDGQSIDWKSRERWYDSAPQNLPRQENTMGSGYYRALKLVKDVITDYSDLNVKPVA